MINPSIPLNLSTTPLTIGFLRRGGGEQKRRKERTVAAIPQDDGQVDVQDDVLVGALVAVEQEDNSLENHVEENQASEPSSSALLPAIQSMMEKMKEEMLNAIQSMREDMEDEMLAVKGEIGSKMESVFDELISVKGELCEARIQIATLEKTLEGYEFQSNEELSAAAKLWCSDRNKAIIRYGHISG